MPLTLKEQEFVALVNSGAASHTPQLKASDSIRRLTAHLPLFVTKRIEDKPFLGKFFKQERSERKIQLREILWALQHLPHSNFAIYINLIRLAGIEIDSFLKNAEEENSIKEERRIGLRNFYNECFIQALSFLNIPEITNSLFLINDVFIPISLSVIWQGIKHHSLCFKDEDADSLIFCGSEETQKATLQFLTQ